MVGKSGEKWEFLRLLLHFFLFSSSSAFVTYFWVTYVIWLWGILYSVLLFYISYIYILVLLYSLSLYIVLLLLFVLVLLLLYSAIIFFVFISHSFTAFIRFGA